MRIYSSRTIHILPLYICVEWWISAGSLSLFTELPSSCKESIQLVNYSHGQIIHFQWIIHFHMFFCFFFTFPWCLAMSFKFWNPQLVSDFSTRCCVWIVLYFLISMLNLVYSVSCQFSHCRLLWCFRTAPHFTHRASFSCCSLSVLFCSFHNACSMKCVSVCLFFQCYLHTFRCSVAVCWAFYTFILQPPQVTIERNDESFKMSFLNVIIMAHQYCKSKTTELLL